MANPIIKIKRGSGAPITLQTGELAMDLQNKSLFVGTAEGVLAVGGEHVFAKKTYVDSAVEAEETARIAADAALASDLAAEVSRAEAAEAALAADIASINTDIAADIAAETSAREAADTALDAKITAEKTRVDAILDASEADKDSFAEIVQLINSVDTENDQAFAGYVLSNDAALAAETSARQAADTALQDNIDDVVSDLSALTTRVSAAEDDIIDERNERETAITALQGDLASAVSDLESADATLQSNIDAEATARSTADTSLSNRIDVLEGASAGSRLDDLEADVVSAEARISALETSIDGGTY
jgi:hypothetical protein